jgi:hypothetical protein
MRKGMDLASFDIFKYIKYNFFKAANAQYILGNPDRWSAYDEGLHFPAMECPELLAKDIISFFHKRF